MATPNAPLQQRAGRNIGIEPALAQAFLQDALAPETDVNTSAGARTTILECPKGMARSPQGMGQNTNAGLIINRSGSSFDYNVVFVDDLGNEAVLLSSQSVASNSVEGFSYGNFFGGVAFVLNPGEKIILKQAGAA